MHILTKQDLSVYYYVKDTLAGTSVNTTDEFPLEGLDLPTVAVENSAITPRPWELGNKKQKEDRTWNIDIFAINKTQRDELSYNIVRALYSGIPVYDYDEGFPPDITPTQMGYLHPLHIEVTPVRIRPELVEKMYYRATVTFVAEYSYL